MALDRSPEINLASLVSKRFGLKPGFDIETFLSSQADLRYDAIPGDVDGISVHLKSKDNKPIVIISSTLPPSRKKFTMAHELGHIFIPWHIGTVFSHTNENHEYADRLYHDCEVEANRFAAELLMPTEWLEELLRNSSPGHAHQTILEIVGTSPEAAFYRIGALLPYNYIGVLTSKTGKVLRSVTTNSRLQRPEEGEVLTGQAVFKSASKAVHTLHTNNIIYWLRYDRAIAPVDKSTMSWRECLAQIAEEVGVDKKLLQSLNGCISAINKPGITFEEYFDRAHQRIVSDNRFKEIFQHPEFAIFLAAKIKEIVTNRKPQN